MEVQTLWEICNKVIDDHLAEIDNLANSINEKLRSAIEENGSQWQIETSKNCYQDTPEKIVSISYIAESMVNNISIAMWGFSLARKK